MDKMDSQTLRLILAVIGAFVIAGVYVWGRWKEKLLDFIQQRGEFDELAELERPAAKPAAATAGIAERIDPPSPFDELEDGESFFFEEQGEPAPTAAAPARESNRPTSLGAPFLIQISVVASGDSRFFDGLELRDALDDLRLIYGDMGIYHRYDREYRVPLFSVASLVEPGTFPIKDMESFKCPGVVLFFQPPQVDNPLAVFDDLVSTCHELAVRLDGVEWDEKRQPLTAEKIAQMRSRLREAY